MSLPSPKAGIVIHYEFLWREEAQKGQEEGSKARPCVILATLEDDDKTMVFVSPITHSPPSDHQECVEIPSKVKQYLGLDDDVSWIAVGECNGFEWPGCDLRRVPSTDKWQYGPGPIPPRLHARLIAEARELLGPTLERGIRRTG